VLSEITLERIIGVIGLVGSLFTGYFFLDSKHLGVDQNERQQLDLQFQILEIDRSRNERLRNYYENKRAAEGSLTEYEQRRLNSVLRNIDRQEQKLIVLESYKRK
jgi:hypothetical protein